MCTSHYLLEGITGKPNHICLFFRAIFFRKSKYCVHFAFQDRDCHRSRRGSPCASEHSLSPPQSSGKTSSDSHCSTSKNERLKHISAEQKRRFNIKIAFNTLHSFVSSSSKPCPHSKQLAMGEPSHSSVFIQTRSPDLAPPPLSADWLADFDSSGSQLRHCCVSANWEGESWCS
ncbi:hypothetical protein AB205_0104780 [Aquarana catesbeiana]|uniref:BHLH domain-containing protein n=1 Tax=Aquarana catesbeiana TaxID=8400 RepID=A0A2G9S344_AQUCT|nr:hypothetical protein AB205_0104780 [Aquarana catesbeiana]